MIISKTRALKKEGGGGGGVGYSDSADTSLYPTDSVERTAPRKMLANNNVITVILFILPNSALIDDTNWAEVTLTMNDPSSRT